MLADGITYSYGVLATEFIQHFNISRSFVGWMGSSLIAITLGSGPLVSYLSERFSYRVVSIMGSVICSIGFAAPYFYPKLWFLFLSSSIISGFGFGLVYLPSIVIVNEWFNKIRPIALGIAVCGSGLGTFLFSPLIEYLIHMFGWEGCMLVLGIMLLLLILCSLTYIKVKNTEIQLEEEKYLEENIEDIKINQKCGKKLVTNFQLLKNPLFILFSLSMFLIGIGFDAPYMFAKDKAIQLGISSIRSCFIISFMGLGNCIGRIIFGILASTKYINRFHLYNISLMSSGIILISNWGLESYVLMLINASIFGIMTGTFITLSSIILVDLFGLENLNITFGLSSIFQAFSVLLGPPLIGLVYDVTLSYNAAYTVCGVSLILGGAIMYLAYFSSYFRKIKFNYE